MSLARRRPLRSASLTLAAAALVLVTSGAAASADPLFTAAHPLAGLAALNADGTANVDALSCPSQGDCGAIGTYIDAAGHVQGFVADQIAGAWGAAVPIPGLAALNAGGAVRDNLVISCTAAGECAAGGRYSDAADVPQAFLVEERAGAWGTAFGVPRDASLPATGPMRVVSISCTSPGSCVAGGVIEDAALQHAQSWVSEESAGTWSGAVLVPGSVALDQGQAGYVTSIACPAAGACSLTGLYADGAGHLGGYVDDQVAGAWGTARPIPGLASLNTGGTAAPTQISCSSPGNCGVGGLYATSATSFHAFVANEVDGTWNDAQTLPDSDALGVGGVAAVTSIACPSDGTCEAVGVYADSPRTVQALVASESGDVWAPAMEMPGTDLLNAGGDAFAASVSCVAAGDCRAVGTYKDSAGALQAFVATQSAGSWADAAEAPGSAALNVKGDANLNAVSCSRDGGCAAGGQYEDSSGSQQAMIVDTSPRAVVPGTPGVRAVSRLRGQVTVSASPTSTGGSPITAYQYSLNGGPWRAGSRGAPSFTIKHLASHARVRIRIRAVNAAGDSAPSRSVTVRVR